MKIQRPSIPLFVRNIFKSKRNLTIRIANCAYPANFLDNRKISLDLNSNRGTFHEVITSIPGPSGVLRRIESRLRATLGYLSVSFQAPCSVALHLIALQLLAVCTCFVHYHPPLTTAPSKGDESLSSSLLEIPRCS